MRWDSDSRGRRWRMDEGRFELCEHRIEDRQSKDKSKIQQKVDEL